MKLFVIFVLLCCFCPLFSQTKIFILNEQKRKICVIAENEWVKLKLTSTNTNKDKLVKGLLLKLNDSVAQMIVVHSFFHRQAIDTVWFSVNDITHAGLYKPIQEPLMSIANSLVWAGTCLIATSVIGGGFLTLVLVGVATTPLSMLSEYSINRFLYPIYPLNGKEWRRVSEKKLHDFLTK